jgi:hypothetical protein
LIDIPMLLQHIGTISKNKNRHPPTSIASTGSQGDVYAAVGMNGQKRVE